VDKLHIKTGRSFQFCNVYDLNGQEQSAQAASGQRGEGGSGGAEEDITILEFGRKKIPKQTFRALLFLGLTQVISVYKASQK
jgi:hypothetical protein